MTGARTVTAAVLALAAACWFVAVREMAGMDMGAATPLGSFVSFVWLWAAMMAAMMLPGAIPVALRATQRLTPFVTSYLALWTLFGIAVYAVYRPHGAAAAGAVAIAAGAYELTPLKRRFRTRCREQVDTGVAFGLACVGSSIGLMLTLVALGVMSVTWMVVIAAIVIAQKLLPAHVAIDVPVALALVAIGIATVV
jgi:predicted metal-binding membrane protein